MTSTSIRAETAMVERPVDDLDAWLSADRVFFEDPKAAQEQMVHHLHQSLAVHLDTNPAYARFAGARGFRLGNLTLDTIDDIPLVPSGLFKRAAATLRSGHDPVITSTSSGTRGTVSRVPRDNRTVMRFFASVTAGVRDLLGIQHSETFVHNVGPTARESNHLWISYVMAGVSLLHDTDFYIRDGVFEAERLNEALGTGVTGGPEIIVGPPPLLLDAAQLALAHKPLDSAPLRYLVSIGGWKRREGELVSRDDFEEVVRSAFGLRRSDAVRDAFNMVELNTVMMECSHGRKHCPPWVRISARDPKTLAPLDSGVPGVLGYADPTPTSFPGMVLSDDFGSVERQVRCPCGVTGDVLIIERRINRLESRGCAMKM